jgi:hypothetical protein
MKVSEIEVEDMDLLCMNIVDTIGVYFDKYPKGKINKKDYNDMVVKISKHLNRIVGKEKEDVVKENTSYIG